MSLYHQGKKLVTIKEVSEMLNVRPSWIRSAIFKKEIPYIKIGNHVRFEEADLLEWIERSKIKRRGEG